MQHNIVTNLKLISEFKKSRYFRVNLGLASTMPVKGPNGDERALNKNDEFAFFYNTTYKTTIYAQGNVGDLKFYTDHYIKEDIVAIYYDYEEFIFPFNFEIIKEKGIDFYLGSLIKEIETQYTDRIQKKKEETDVQRKKELDPSIVKKNPGMVSYEDIKAYMSSKNKERLG